MLLRLAWVACPALAGPTVDADIQLHWDAVKRVFCSSEQLLVVPVEGDRLQRASGCRREFSYRWDEQGGPREGRVLFHLDLPPLEADQSMALFFSRVGNQATIRLNGHVLTHMGTLGNSRFDAAKTARLVALPPALLSREHGSQLDIEITTQPMRWGGLSTVRYGPLGEIEPMYTTERRWRHTSYLLFAMALMLFGAMAAGLWWRQRDPLYGCFALAALLGIWRNIDRVWSDVWVPWPLWGGLVAASYACHLLLMCRFVLLLVDATGRSVMRAIWCAMAACVVLAVLSFAGRMPMLWSVALGLVVPVGLWAYVSAWRKALVLHSPLVWWLVAVGTLALLAGLWDYAAVHLGWSRNKYSIAPHAMFLFVVVMAIVVVDRYSDALRRHRVLNDTLSDQVAAREQALRQAFEAMQAQQRAHAVTEERQRMMRDIHDGVGAQLVGLLNLVRGGAAGPAQLTEQVQQALDEMRMAVDALQPVDGDLATVLGTLRYRLQPRLQAAGLTVQWDMPPLPPVAGLSPQVVLQIQRIALEAFTNVLKHAHATRIVVSAAWHDAPASVVLSVTDDGVGMAPGGTPGSTNGLGHGLRNMQARAAQIGAALVVGPALPRGTHVQLTCPVELHSAP